MEVRILVKDHEKESCNLLHVIIRRVLLQNGTSFDNTLFLVLRFLGLAKISMSHVTSNQGCHLIS